MPFENSMFQGSILSGKPSQDKHIHITYRQVAQVSQKVYVIGFRG
jgi:hypothetical protein